MKLHRIDQIAKPRFRIAIHVLVWLAQSGGVLSSTAIASQVNSHATFLRRVLAQLTRSGIVEAKEGRDGGYYMQSCPEELTLADIYAAIPDEREHDPKDDLDCGEVGRQLDRELEVLMSQAEEQIISFLRQHTLADVMAHIDFQQMEQRETEGIKKPIPE
ncbi:RrF2 family transcriptional regulator [Brevibacillus sp. NRS-1366]|uniref:RrF2 family transcriptional regulator n=1 Tax=Brevibacillus sp. NRS-1366 TaxID=3233899 RepID=UPI003D1B488B